MASQSDVKTVDTQDASVSPKRRFDARDWDYIAEFVIDEYNKRKRDRNSLERIWADIDRQIAMEPDVSYKKLANGKPDLDKNWMSEVELPLQAQALEVLKADARRLMFPDTGLFFRAHGAMTDDYLQTVELQSLILGDQTEVPSLMTQDNIDKLVEGFVLHQFAQTDFPSRMDRINAEGFKYGMGVGRGRMETKNVYIDEARGRRKETQKIPVLVPCSIKNLYLDDMRPSIHSSHVLGPAHIWVDNIRYENLALAASRGSSDPDDEDGGWMAGAIKKIEADDNGYVQLLEMEGDIIVPRKTVRSIVIPGAVVTVALGGKDGGGNATRAVVRFRFRKYPFSSYMLFPYQYESANDAYSTSPLMKGRPLQILATEAANRMIDSGALKIAAPVGWDRSDPVLAAQGGPKIHPYAKWGSNDPASLKVFTELGGDPSTMGAIMTNAISLYADLVGVLPARLGAQTISHTTAFAKDAELQRGAVRTVNYVNASGQGPMLKWLDMAYQMGRDSIGKDKISFFIASYGGFVEVSKEQLPEQAVFEWLGAGGPQDENQKLQNKVNGLLLASKLDAINAQTGKPMRIDYNKAIDQVLRESGWSDLDAIRQGETSLAGAQVGPGPAVAALQNLALQQPQ
jgi:hypothetical protein